MNGNPKGNKMKRPDALISKKKQADLIKFFAGLLLGAFVLLFFLPSLKMPFFWDDVFVIEYNPHLDKPGKPWEVFYKQNLTSGGADHQNFDEHIYRPLRTLYFMAVTRLFGKSEVHFHLLSLLGHFTVFFLLWRFFQRERNFLAPSFFWPSLFCLWFLFHPVHLENINMISGVGDILGSILFLFVLLFIQKKNVLTGIEVLGIALGVYLAMLFKEMFITLPVLLFLLFRQIKPLQGISLCLVSVAYYFQRLWIIPHVAQIDLAQSFTERAAYTAKAFFYYLYLFFCPQFPSENYLCPAGLPPEGWIGLFLLVISGIGLGCLVKKTRGVAVYGAAWLVSMLPILHLIPINTFVNDRLFYFPSLMGVLLLSKMELSMNSTSLRSRVIFRSLGLILVVVFSTVGFLQNLKWEHPQKIWQEAWEKTNSIRSLWNMVYEMEREKNYRELLDYFETRPVFIPEEMHCFYYQELCFSSAALNQETGAKEYLKLLLETMKNPYQKAHYKEKDLKNLIVRLKELSHPLAFEMIERINQAEGLSGKE